MIQGQYESIGQPVILRPHRSRLLHRHPVLLPVALLGSAIGLCISSFFADTLLPLLTLPGASPTLVCLSLALVLGVAGILTGIVGIIERIDRYQLQTRVFSKPKEQSYANRD